MDALIDEEIDEVVEDISTIQPHSEDEIEHALGPAKEDVDFTVDITYDKENDKEIEPQVIDEGDRAEPAHLVDNITLEVGDRVKVFWPTENQYYPGTVLRHN